MTPVKHTWRSKSGGYYFRYTLPRSFRRFDCRSKKSIYLSLRTHDPKKAKVLSSALWARLQLIMTSKKINNSGEQSFSIKAYLKNYLLHIEHAEPYEQRAVYWGTETFNEVLEHVERDFRLLAKYNLLAELEEDFSNLDELSALAEKIRERIKRERIQKIAENAVNAEALGSSVDSANSNSAESQSGSDSVVTLSIILAAYLSRNDSSDVKWKPKTREHERSRFSFLIETVGDIPVHAFSESQLRDFNNALQKRTRKFRGEDVPISAQTRNEYLRVCKRVFDFAEAHYESVAKNLFANKSIYFKAKQIERLPFSNFDLSAMFSHPIFTEGEFDHPYKYWIPLLALFSGCRQNELAQLHVDDIVKKEGITCINLNSNTPDKTFKVEDQERFLPLHPKLIELGFEKFVQLFKKQPYRWKDESGYYRLFKGLSLDKKNGGYKKNLSRWFNGGYNKKKNEFEGFKYEAGIEIPDGAKKDFHSFRHTCASALENAGVPNNIGFKITGHAIDTATKKQANSAGGRYRHDLELKKKYEAICKLNFDKELAAVKPFFEIGGEKKCLPKRSLK